MKRIGIRRWSDEFSRGLSVWLGRWELVIEHEAKL